MEEANQSLIRSTRPTADGRQLQLQEAAGAAANRAAAAGIFERYRAAKSQNTLRAHDFALVQWAAYMTDVMATADREAVEADAYATQPESWFGVTWGLIEGFVQWQLNAGYSIGTVNQRLSVVRTYATLAAKAGVVDPTESHLIATVRGFGSRQGKNVDAQRPVTRVGHKKEENVVLAAERVEEIKAVFRSGNTPQHARDWLLLCLLADHGLRVSELQRLSPTDFNEARTELVFYRPKVDQTTTHRLTADTRAAAQAYLAHHPSPTLKVPLLLGTTRLKKDGSGGQLREKRLSRRAIQKRAEWFGMAMGYYEAVGCHDFRHFAATQMARSGHAVRELMDFFGWTSAATAMRYVDAAQIAQRHDLE
jgi:integrase